MPATHSTEIPGTGAVGTVVPAEGGGASAAPRRAARRGGWARELTLVPAILFVGLIGFALSANFLTVSNLLDNVLVTSAVLAVIVVAESIILISGNFDLSLEANVSLAPMVAIWLVVGQAGGGLGWEWSPWAAIAVAVVVAVVVGLVNGFLVAKLGLNAFIVTLAMLILLQGVTTGISGGATYATLPDSFVVLGSARFLGLSVQVWIALIVIAAAAVFMTRFPLGRKIYATGGNPEAAAAAGIKTKRITAGVFVVGALLAALAGFMLTSRIASVTATQGSGIIFTVFAAAVIGGISLDGGRGSILGAALGVLLLGMIQNILTLSNIPSFWINASYGLIILAALILNYVTGLRSRRST
jgi:simple sugar transport system permease protein